MKSRDVHRRTGWRSLPVALILVGVLLFGAAVSVMMWGPGAASWVLAPAPVSAQSEAERVAIGHDLVVRADERVHGNVSVTNGSVTVLGVVDGDVTVVNGNADIEGRVSNDVAVTNGNVRLASGSSVGGNVVVVTGKVTREEGASVGGTVSVLDVPIPDLGGSMWLPVSSMADRTLLGADRWNSSLSRFTGFVGLGVLGLLVMAVGVLVTLLMPARMRVSADTLEAEAGPSIVVGVIVGLLLWPVIAVVSVGLAITVVGIVLIPVAVIAALLLVVLGLVVVSVALGRRMLVPGTADMPDAALQGVGGSGTSSYRPTSIVLEGALGMAVILSSTLLPLMLVPGWVKVLLLALGFFACCLGVGALLLSRFGRLAPRAAGKQA